MRPLSVSSEHLRKTCPRSPATLKLLKAFATVGYTFALNDNRRYSEGGAIACEADDSERITIHVMNEPNIGYNYMIKGVHRWSFGLCNLAAICLPRLLGLTFWVREPSLRIDHYSHVKQFQK